ALQPLRDVRPGEHEVDRLLLLQQRVVRDPERRGRQPGGMACRCERERRGERDEQPQTRNDQSLLPTKVSGTVSPIAIACETSGNESMKMKRQIWFATRAMPETTKNLMPW